MYNNKSRTRMSQRNLAVNVIGRIVTMITSFVGRSVFVTALGSQYLGLGGFFGNIFSVISLCELGICASIVQSLYKPLAREDEYEVSAIVKFYSHMCKIIALVTTILSLAVLPFLSGFVKAEIDKSVVVPAYLLFVIHSAVSYILSPKCSLVACDQRMYVVTAIRSLLSVFALAMQCAVLVFTGNYVLYLVSRILFLTLEDIIINMYADKKYPCLTIKARVTDEYKKRVFTNVKALVWHKAGGVITRSTDSLLLTYFVGLSGVGKYSNYALVIGTIGAFFDVAMNAVSASVGNLGASDRGRKSENVMRKMYFLNFWLLTVGTCVTACTLNPLIELWLGREMLFSNIEMLVIVSSFYFSCIRDPVQIFVSTYGLFRESRFIPVLRALANILLSVFFVGKIGIAGVFLGTALSTVAVPLYFEVSVLYKYGFSASPRRFLGEMLCYIATSLLCTAVCFAATYNMHTSVTGLFMRALCSFCMSNVIIFVLYCDSEYFESAKRLVKRCGTDMHKSKL